MSEKETSLKQTIIDLTDELRSYRYALLKSQEQLETFLKLGQLWDLQFKEQTRMFQDLCVRLLTITSYMDGKIDKILNVVAGLSRLVEKLNNNQSIEVLTTSVNEQVKTNSLLEDVKVLLQQQLDIRKQTALESAKLKKKIEQNLSE
jgi:uncharacterized protein YkvS